ncbi:MAG: hypothetical protein R3323_07195 [Wenzhouxiangellaceae bacterium]|nr:hypothetical protein [Wenzhouxiangellaceae bacterium]
MSQQLKTFLKNLGQDPDVRKRYQQDPESVMDEHGLSDEHKELVRNKDKDALQKEAGVEDAHMDFIIL